MQFKLDTVLRPVIISAKSYGLFTSAQCSPSKISEVSAGTSISLHFSPGTSLKVSFSHIGAATPSFP